MLQGRRSCTVARSGAYELGVAQTSKSFLRFLQLFVEAMCFTFVSTTNQCIISTSSHQKYSKNRISIISSHVIPKSSYAPARTNGFHRLNQLFLHGGTASLGHFPALVFVFTSRKWHNAIISTDFLFGAHSFWTLWPTGLCKCLAWGQHRAQQHGSCNTVHIQTSTH